MSESGQRAITALIVDDSIMMRALLRRALTAGGIHVLDMAVNGREALQKIDHLNPDVVTLDVEMPGLSGLDVLQSIMQSKPRPVVMVSGLTREGAQATFECLEKGAIDYVSKPLPGEGTLRQFSAEVVEKVRTAASSNLRQLVRQQMRTRPAAAQKAPIPQMKNGSGRIVVIGISAGGPATLARFLPQLPEDFPPIAIVQHMPAQFTGPFAARLNSACRMEVREAKDGDLFEPGKVLIAPGDWHMRLHRSGAHWVAKLDQSQKISGFRPSADVLLTSAAESAGPAAIGVVMTGMGCDGSQGARALKAAGGTIIAQDEASSVVFGMPKSAIATGCVDHVCNLQDLPHLLHDLLRTSAAPVP